MTRLMKCSLLISAVAVILGFLIFLLSREPSPAERFLKEHPYHFSETKEWGEESQDSYTENGGCIFSAYPETDNEESMKIIDGFTQTVLDRFQEFSATAAEQAAALPEDQPREIPRLILDYTAEKKENHIALRLFSASGLYKEDGKGTDSHHDEKVLYLSEDGAPLGIAELLGKERMEKLSKILDRSKLSIDTLEDFTYQENEITLKWEKEERTFTMEEIERGGKIDPEKPMIALTFDDGPGQYTKQFADLLTRYNGHCTFFMLGINVGNYKESVKYAYDQGHEIASHTMRHKDLCTLSQKDITKEISDADQVIKSVIGEKPNLVRPPYGSAKSTVASIAGRPLIHWNLDTEDWRTRNPEAIKTAILNEVSDGAIILMHEIYDTSYEGLEQAMEELDKQGYQFVTVSELMEYRKVTPQAKSYFSFPK